MDATEVRQGSGSARGRVLRESGSFEPSHGQKVREPANRAIGAGLAKLDVLKFELDLVNSQPVHQLPNFRIRRRRRFRGRDGLGLPPPIER